MATRFWKLVDGLSVLVPVDQNVQGDTLFPAFLTYCPTDEALNLDPWSERDEFAAMMPMGPAQAQAAKEIQMSAHAEAVGSKDVLGYAKWISSGSLTPAATPLLIKECSSHTGSRVWEGALLQLQWVFQNQQLMKDRSVLELGAGCGILGLSMAKAGIPREVVISDFDGHYVDAETASLMELLTHNAKANMVSTSGVSIWNLDWARPADAKCCWPPAADATLAQTYDIVLGSELLYTTEGAALLLQILPKFLADGGTCYLLNNARRTGVAEFMAGCAGAHLTYSEVPFDKFPNESLAYTMGENTFDNTYIMLKITHLAD